ncbi:DUF2142 domain-containing protein [Hyalangium minutum]|nr:DUF2142 domain-containing protein [Hyalangium minutum]
MSPDSRSKAWPAWLMAGCYGLWLVAWSMATPLFSGADEWAHYLRTVGIREGRWIGDRLPEDFDFPGFTPAQQAFLRQTSRFIDVPAGMAPRGYGCNAFVAEQSAGCLAQAGAYPEARREVTVTGAYPPAFYLLPAVAMLPAHSPSSALPLARLANLLVCGVLLGLALRALAETPEPAPALTAFAVALTPMGLGTMAALSPSGPEVAGALTFAAGLYRLASQPRGGPWAWAACLVGGVALGIARALGVAWVVLLVGSFLVLLGRAGVVQLARHQRSRVLLGGGLLLGALLLSRLWERLHGATVPVTLLPSLRAWREAFKHYPVWLREQVGVFQYLDAEMPAWAYPAWGVLLLALGVGCWPRLSAGWRWRAGVVAVGILAVPLGLYAMLVRNSEFWLQGRYVLPLTCALPLLFGAGALSAEREEQAQGQRFPWVWLAGGAGFLHAVAWYSNARRSAVGNEGPWLFFSSAEWQPPLGWASGCVLALLCAVALPLCVWWAGRTGTCEPHATPPHPR